MLRKSWLELKEPIGFLFLFLFFLSNHHSLSATFNGFAPPISIPVGRGPHGVVAADFNGDGILDLAVANLQDNSVSILLGKGDGTFALTSTLPVGINPFSVVVGDFGNGHLDLAVANGNGYVSVLLGNGDGTFQPQTQYFVSSKGIEAVEVGDFNHDKKLDIATADGLFDVSILNGNGNGTFQPAIPFPATFEPTAIAVGDFNHDGFLDIAVTNFLGGVAILLNQGNGTFGVPTAYTTAIGSSGVAVGDFNRDGNLDLAVSNVDPNNVSVLLGNSNGTFNSAQNYAVGLGPFGVAVGDFNQDGFLDIVTPNNISNNVSLLFGNGDGTFQPAMNFPAGSAPLGIAVGDFNGDGLLDLAVTNFDTNTVSILLQIASQTITFAPIPTQFFPEAPFTVTATASSSLPVTLTVVSGPATISGNIVTITGIGKVVLAANQPGNAFFAQAPEVFITFNVLPRQVRLGQRISFAPIPDQLFGELPFEIFASSSSHLPVIFKVLRGPAVVNGNVVTLTGVGEVAIEAIQPGNARYFPARPVIRTFAVLPP